MYFPEDKVLNKLNITKEDLYFWRSIGHIRYSFKTDKYDIDSVLEKRTLTIGLEKLLTPDDYQIVTSKMERQSSFSRWIFSQLQKGNTLTASECSKLGQQPRWGLMAYEALSAFPFAKGKFDSMNSHYNKTIKNLENKIIQLKSDIKKATETNEHQKYNSKWVKGKKHKLQTLLNKLTKYQSKSYLPTWFGRRYKDNPEMYKNSRMELVIQGEELRNGNRNIRIQRNKEGELELYLYQSLYSIKIPNSHKDTFYLDNFNRQSCRISFNKNGKLILNITYNYIKPVQRQIHKPKGSVGIDIGPKEIAVCFVKNDGNPLEYLHFSTGNLLDKSTEETKREISLILNEIIKKAEYHGFNQITVENLQFKPDHSFRSKKLNRMLNKFPRSIFLSLLESKCSRRGFKLKKINPAYTSVIGLFKYSNRDNLCTSHNAKSKDLSAALTIGRRGLGLNEKAIICLRVFGKLISIPVTSILSSAEHEFRKSDGYKESGSNWSLWSQLKGLYKTPDELTAHLLVNPKPLIKLAEIRGSRCNSLNLALIKIGASPSG